MRPANTEPRGVPLPLPLLLLLLLPLLLHSGAVRADSSEYTCDTSIAMHRHPANISHHQYPHATLRLAGGVEGPTHDDDDHDHDHDDAPAAQQVCESLHMHNKHNKARGCKGARQMVSTAVSVAYLAQQRAHVDRQAVVDIVGMMTQSVAHTHHGVESRAFDIDHGDNGGEREGEGEGGTQYLVWPVGALPSKMDTDAASTYAKQAQTFDDNLVSAFAVQYIRFDNTSCQCAVMSMSPTYKQAGFSITLQLKQPPGDTDTHTHPPRDASTSHGHANSIKFLSDQLAEEWANAVDTHNHIGSVYGSFTLDSGLDVAFGIKPALTGFTTNKKRVSCGTTTTHNHLHKFLSPPGLASSSSSSSSSSSNSTSSASTSSNATPVPNVNVTNDTAAAAVNEAMANTTNIKGDKSAGQRVRPRPLIASFASFFAYILVL